MVDIVYTPSGALQITIPPTACACGHAHPSATNEWDTVIRAASKWISDNAPVCRGFSGVEPWARGDSPVTLMVAKRPAKKSPPSLIPDKADVSAVGLLSDAASKQTRSAFGCDACKKRKIKCDEQRPTCTNCCASSRKRARRCVYAYDFIARPSHRETPVRETVAQEESTPGPSSRGMSSDDHLEPATSSERPVMLPLAGKALRAEPDSHPSSLAALAPHDIRHLTPQAVDAEALSRLVDKHGLTWFINATEIVENQVLSSNQRQAFKEYRQAVLERCWNAYINCHGKLPLSLPSTPSVASADTPTNFLSAMNSMIGLPGLSTLSSPEGTMITPQQIADLTQAALLHAFVAHGAMHYAYWAGKRGEPAEEHQRGGASLMQLSTNALLQVLQLRERIAPGELAISPAELDDWEEEIEAKLLMTTSFSITYRVCAADVLGPATLRLQCELIAQRGGPAAIIQGMHLTPAQTEVISTVINDGIYALTRGEPGFLPPDPAWLDTIPILQRIIPEGYGISLEMAKYIIETVAVLYGPRIEDRATRLEALHRTLTTSVLVDIYASAHPARVQTGDMLYRQALICVVCLDGLGLSPDDQQLVAASDAILELFAEAVHGDIYTVRWALPLLIGGGLAPKQNEEQAARGERDRRAEAGRIFDAMADTCGLGDIEAARLLTEKVWERKDAGKSWRLKDVMREENLELFLV